nr:hypothetical protein [Streptomyces sp. SID5785]
MWPVAARAPFTFLELGAAMTPDEVGTAVMSLAACNDVEPDDAGPPRPAGALDGFLHGLLTLDPLFAAGGLRVTDTRTGVRLDPGCCTGLEDRGDWWAVVDETRPAAWFGHDPTPAAERDGATIRLTVDAEAARPERIEVSAAALRGLLAGVEDDLAGFLRLAGAWADERLPGHADRVRAALARALARS